MSAFFIFKDGYCVPVIDFRPNDAPSISSGDHILASGTINPRRGQPLDGFVNANCRTAVVLGHDPPIRHIPITADDIQRQDLLRRPVRIVGTLADMRVDDIDPNFTIFVLDCSNRIVYAESRTLREDLRRQIGAMVSVEGILNKSYGKRVHGRLFISVRNDNAIKILKSPSNDWFQAPEIGATEKIPPEAIVALGRRKVSGHVLATWNGDTLLLRSTSNSLVKVTLIVAPPPVGTDIEVVGIAETDLFRVNLSHAIWRTASHPMPHEADAIHDTSTIDLIEDAKGRRRFDMTWHGRRVRLRGTVRDILGEMRHGPRFLLEDGRNMATVDCGAAPDAIEKLRVGCVISVVGVCVMDTENWNQHSMLPKVTGMFISVSSPGDIKILATPPWWTPFKLMVVIGVLVLLIVAILIWNALLRILSERRGRELFRSQIARAESELRIKERTRRAAELHDHLAQNLTAISYQIAAAERSNKIAPESSAQHLGTAARMLGSCRTDLRRCLWDLRSDALDEPDFAQAIRRTTEPVAGEAEVAVDFTVPRARISDTTAHALLSIVRELTANAANHGHARRIRIAGEISAEQLHISVADDGTGFDPAAAADSGTGHFGLDGIRERLLNHNGELAIESAPGKGTTVSIFLKLNH
jgi:signal transduction histidine kinase